jgi:hypothetical protein
MLSPSSWWSEWLESRHNWQSVSKSVLASSLLRISCFSKVCCVLLSCGDLPVERTGPSCNRSQSLSAVHMWAWFILFAFFILLNTFVYRTDR